MVIAAIKVFVAASCFKDLMLDTVRSLHRKCPTVTRPTQAPTADAQRLASVFKTLAIQSTEPVGCGCSSAQGPETEETPCVEKMAEVYIVTLNVRVVAEPMGMLLA